jgi:hypothetical protein
MSRSRPIERDRSACWSAWFCAVVTALLFLTCGAAQADTLGLRFYGTADLTGFGGNPMSAFAGGVTWDPDTGWVPEWPGCPDFCLDGSPGAVSATFSIDSVDYTGRIDPASRFIVWGFGGLSLDLYFTPRIDFDGGNAPDVRNVSLDLFSHPPDYSLFVDSELPDDLAFLPHLNHRVLVFRDRHLEDERPCEVCVGASTLTVVPEPSSAALVVTALLAGRFARRRRHGVTQLP